MNIKERKSACYVPYIGGYIMVEMPSKFTLRVRHLTFKPDSEPTVSEGK